MPRADVATSALTRLPSRASSAARRSASSVRDLLGGRHREAVDDAGARQVAEMCRQPGQALGRALQPDDAQLERGPVEVAAEHEDGVLGGRRPLAGLGGAGGQLLGDVGRHAGVRRRGGGEHRDAGRQVRQQGADAAVVRAEVVAPVGDAVGLVDHHEAGLGRQAGEGDVAEVGVVEALGRDQEDVDHAGPDLVVDALPRVAVGGVDRDGADAGAPGGGDLVAHEREEGRDDDGGAGAPGPQECGGDEVDRGLAPAGALDDERATVTLDERLDGRPLVVTQARVGAADEGLERELGLVPQRAGRTCGVGRGGGGCGGGWHASSLPRGSDRSAVVHRKRARSREDGACGLSREGASGPPADRSHGG
jgi:hypothetical protein